MQPSYAAPFSRVSAAVVAVLLLLVAVQVARADEEWQVLKDCRLLPNESNDADSFHVMAAGKEYLFRLYFIDAPETDTSVPERVNEQSRYFGISVGQTVQLGNLGKQFTKAKLGRPFTVRTCMQDAMGRSRMQRFYAFIEAADGDLAELLVVNGLARVYGSSATPLGLSSPEVEWEKLRGLESQAKAQKVGGWGAASDRMTARSATQPPKSGPGSFDAFFHPVTVSGGTTSGASSSVAA
ncbi:MAG: thermonuclease family protein, partial [Chthoniobacterales bacterium]|nr:thermonuclease family protein [Chthoniobacterales bacterium]